MAKGYMLANIDVTDLDAYQEYVAKVPATVEQYGGRYLVRGGAQEPVEGDAPLSRTVLLEFPSLDQARTWYRSPEYTAIVGIRQGSSIGRVYFVEGV